MLSTKLYQKEETAFNTSIFSLKDSLIDSINTNSEYSKITGLIKLDTISNKEIKSIKVLPTIKIDSSDTEILLVITINYKGKSVFWKSYKIQSQIKKLGEWETISQIQNFEDFYFNNEYIIKTYLWNNTKSKYFLKNISIKLYDEPQTDESLIFVKN